MGDPDRVSTLAPAMAHVSVTCLLLGCAVGTPEQLAELHGTRVEMLLARMLDTTVRAVVYEASGSVDPLVLAAGAERVRVACKRSRIPYRLLEVDPANHAAWLAAATSAVERVLSE